MDISETYIKMCEEAEEIQKKWKPFNGDFIIQKDYLMLPAVVLHFCNDDKLLNFKKENFIWLPRQDQLQEIYCEQTCSWIDMFKHFKLWLKMEVKSLFDYNSMEQLWLAFVMKEKWGIDWPEDKPIPNEVPGSMLNKPKVTQLLKPNMDIRLP